ncbi:hypothetical protein FA95DRAFT_1458304, partial [Auriscalpium vulgare]
WFIEARNALEGNIDEPEWGSCLASWTALEQAAGEDKTQWLNVNLRIRPSEVHDWLKSGRKIEKPPYVTNVNKFGVRWRSWWTVMQPTWRKPDEGGDWPLVRAEHPDEAWSNLRKAGKNGLVLVLHSLVWWTTAAKTDSQKREVLSALEDVEW